MPQNSNDSLSDLLQQRLSKSPELAAKQGRLLKKLSESTSSAPPAGSTSSPPTAETPRPPPPSGAPRKR